MIINLSPVGDGKPLPVVVTNGDQISIDGAVYDFSELSEGDTVPADAMPDPFLGPADRIGGQVIVTLRLSFAPDMQPPDYVAFPEPIAQPADGQPLDLPFQDRVELIEKAIPGGVELTITTHRWRQPPLVAVHVQLNEEEDAGDVEA